MGPVLSLDCNIAMVPSYEIATMRRWKARGKLL